MRYFGSKVSTIGTLYEIISSKMPTGEFCDPFGGIGSVGSYFKTKGYTVWSGDILRFAHYFQVARLKYKKQLRFNKLKKHYLFKNTNQIVNYLNEVVSDNGWFVEEYSQKRKFFIEINARKIEGCRNAIQRWNEEGLINKDEKKILLASLINSMDQVANTAGTYYAYLKRWNNKAIKTFKYKLIDPVSSDSRGHCYRGPASKLVQSKHYDILYLDPPYNERSYAHYYHLPETIAQGSTPEVFGKSGIPKDLVNSSDFSRPSKVHKALINILERAKFTLLVFHYADNGLLKSEEIKSILRKHGRVHDLLIDSKGYTTKNENRTVKHHLYYVNNA